jgi:hypothetical protein
MAKNIYDLFNERKNGIDYLVEGLDPSDYVNLEAYEGLDAAAEALNTITVEATNEMMEFQAASYLEDLVLENMMYEEFDEEKIQATLEAAKEEKKEGLGQKIKKLWQQIKEWFARAMKTIAVHFQSGETLVLKYKKDIPKAIQQSTAKVKCKAFRDPDKCMDEVNGLVADLKARTGGRTKETILKMVGVSDKNGITEKVEGIFFDSEKKEHPVNRFPADVVMKWAGNKKIFIDSLKKSQREVDNEFKEILAQINKGDGENKAEEAKVFEFGIGVVNKLLSASIICIKNVSNLCTQIIRKALGGKYDDKKPGQGTAPNSSDREKELEFNKKVSDAGFKAKDANAISRKKVGVSYGPEKASYVPDVEGLEEGYEPDFEFIDEVEDDNNIEW